MRIIQLIDSLNTGGAERIAINYANSLTKHVSFSGIICTREEGDLKLQLNSKVHYFFLNRKTIIDIKALKLFNHYIKSNNIEIIHAHGSSYFIAVLMKFRHPSIKIFYHEHNGERLKKNNFFLIISSFFFNRVLTVNLEIQNWLKLNFLCKKIDYIPNFAVINNEENDTTLLKGGNSKKIVCLANLRNPKNHILLLESFFEINDKNWTLHLIGKDYNDDYSEKLKNYILNNNLKNKIFLYNSRLDINHILKQAEIGVLCSILEGFPLAILEYGLANLAVISSDVGFCKEIIIDEKTGLLFSSNNKNNFKIKLIKMTKSESLRKKLSQNLNKLILENYSENSVIDLLLKYYRT